jgi:hypothetical protein
VCETLLHIWLPHLEIEVLQLSAIELEKFDQGKSTPASTNDSRELMKENVMWFTTLRDCCTPTFCNSIKEKVISTAKGFTTSIQKHKTLLVNSNFKDSSAKGFIY